MPRSKKSPWNGDSEQSKELRLAMAKKAAAKLEAAKPSRGSWWAVPGLTREEFQQEVRRRHQELMQSPSDSVRSMGKMI